MVERFTGYIVSFVVLAGMGLGLPRWSSGDALSSIAGQASQRTLAWTCGPSVRRFR
jgi:hypothetical protein